MKNNFFFGIGLLILSFGFPLWIANLSMSNSELIVEEPEVSYEEISVVLSSEPGLILQSKNGTVHQDLPYLDLDDHWVKNHVEQLYLEGILTHSELFRPEDPITRAEILTLIGRSFYGTITHSSTALHFEDVAYDHPYFDVVAWAYETGLAQGSTDGNFYPDSKINRATGLKVLIEGAGFFELSTVIPNYKDVLIYEDWFASYTSFSKTNSLYSGELFYADRPMTRAEAVKLIVQLKTLINS